MTALQEKVETAGTDVVQKFKTSQSFIDSCADYYGTRFDNCLKQVASAFPELELSRISMDAPEPMTPTRNIVTDMMMASQSPSLRPRLTTASF